MKKKVRCPYCSSQQVQKILSMRAPYSVYTCHSCLLVFTYPQPSQVKKVNKIIYDSQEEFESRIGDFSLEYKRAKKHVLNFKEYKKSGKYLDIGCSYGIGLLAAKDLGFQVTGVEPTGKAASYAKKTLHLHVIPKTLLEAHLSANSFDVISLYDVLEHIPDLREFLYEIKRILRKNGILVIQSPNVKSFAFLLLQKRWNWLLVPHHLWHFSKTSITNVLQENGFSIVSFETNDNVYDLASNMRSKLFHYQLPKTLIEKITQKLVYFFCYAIIFLSTPIWSFFGKGGSLVVYAQKNKHYSTTSQ